MGKGEGMLSAIGTRWLRRLVVLLVSFFALSAGAAAQAATTTIRVNTTKDLATGGKCSLRLAIATVNSPGTKTACGVADQISDLIVLGPNTYKLSIPPKKKKPDDNSRGDLNLTSKVPMLQMVGSGPGATLIQGSSKLHDRLLTVSKQSSLVISGMTMLGGHAPDGAAGTGTCAAGVGADGGSGADGGAILNQGGSLFLFLVTLSGNHAGNGGAGAPAAVGPGCDGGNGGSGGGIYNAGGYVNVTSSTISGNHAGAGGDGGAGASGPVGGAGGNGGAGGSGGGIANDGGDVVIGGTTVLGAGDAIASNHAGAGGNGADGGSSNTGNTSGGNGGAGGQGGDGGGFFTTSPNPASPAGSFGVTNSTLTANRSGAGGNGGTGGKGSGTGSQGSGGAGGAGGNGGAVAGISSPSRMASTTIASNSSAAGGKGGSGSPTGGTGAAGDGGGLYASSSASAADMTLQNTLVASNTPRNCPKASGSDPIVNGGYDLSFPDKTCPAVTHGDPKLKKLSDYGGFTYSMALEPGSAAINRGPPKGAGCPARDQRAVRRPQGKACDIGAFEFAVPKVLIYTPRNGARYKRGSRVVADYRCTEGGSSTTPITPIASCNGTVFTGQRINTHTLGRKKFTVTARDLAGNKTVKTIHYTVVKRR